MTQTLIDLQQVKKIFYTDELESHAVSNISLRIQAGEYLSISGPSGCGKSTLLSIIGLLDSPTDGRFLLSGTDVTAISKRERAKIRNKEIGFIFQSFNLISDLDVQENVELPLTYRSGLTKSERKERVQQALSEVEMNHRCRHFPSQLSGGQQQRVAIARAIAGSPSILLADEPTGNLDSKNAEAVMALLDRLHAKGATICMVTHDPRSAMRSDRVIEIVDGQVVGDHTSNQNIAQSA